MSTPTIKDVALRAETSVASVSRALAGQPGVSEAMRRRVLLAAEELGYRPDEVARSLRRRQTNLIGLVVSTIENVFFTEVARAAERTALSHGYNLLISSTDELLDREESSIAVLHQQLVAGIVLAPAPGDLAGRDYLASSQTPIVLINREPDDAPFPSVRADDEPAAFACVRWMIDQGRTRIAVIAGLPNISTTRDRLAGYRRALNSASLIEDPDFVVPGHASVEGGYDAARDLMNRAAPPDAIFVHNNVMLSGAMLALQDLGIRWPNQVDVAGFGAFSEARLYAPPLTVIAQPAYEMGRVAIELLVDRIRGRASEAPAKVVLPNRLVTREDWVRQQSDRRAGVKRSAALAGDSHRDLTPALARRTS
jgi:LacI family transcriptional regulator